MSFFSSIQIECIEIYVIEEVYSIFSFRYLIYYILCTTYFLYVRARIVLSVTFMHVCHRNICMYMHNISCVFQKITFDWVVHLINCLFHLTLDTNGNLYVSDHNNNRIKMFVCNNSAKRILSLYLSTLISSVTIFFQ